ncbi:MAG: hypothetical protein IPK17_20270 [Chloroflexi bacterium]|uniref:tetratricopeptide repeat protein n=1 Tax=Candidatus Flexifilum breve TaxID=3140694 RepID=UPI003134D140|nr:hypothetical protein [Chloroflexota bacterium]
MSMPIARRFSTNWATPAALTDIDAALAIYEENPARTARANPTAIGRSAGALVDLPVCWNSTRRGRASTTSAGGCTLAFNGEAALSDFEAILATDPAEHRNSHATAEAQDALKDKEDALETFEDALDINEYDSYAVRRSADPFYDLERWDEARDYYEWYIELVGDATESYVRERLTSIEDMSARGSEETGK